VRVSALAVLVAATAVAALSRMRARP
jgi:hypothetical protein